MWVNMGNPHAVTIVPDVLTADVERIGPQVESHTRFPSRVNAGFMQIIDENISVCVYMNVVSVRLFSLWYRACGSGEWYAPWLGLPMRLRFSLQAVSYILPGVRGDVVWMTGPTTHVYDARLDLRYFQS